jgi:hypothetical protein
MKKKRGILVVIILLGVLAAAAWIFLRPNSAAVIKGNLPPRDAAAIRSLVKKDMAKRLLPDYSWASVKGLLPNLRAYFKYNIVEIDSHGPDEAAVRVGDGRTVEASKHLCDYLLVKDTDGWSVVVIISGNSLSGGGAPTLWYSAPPTNRAGAGPFVAARLPQRSVRTSVSNSFSFAKSGLPFSTNLTVPRISLGGGSVGQKSAPPAPTTNGSSPTITNNYVLTLGTPSTTHFISGTMSAGTGPNGKPIMINFNGPGRPGRIVMPGRRGSLTNLMPLGN